MGTRSAGVVVFLRRGSLLILLLLFLLLSLCRTGEGKQQLLLLLALPFRFRLDSIVSLLDWTAEVVGESIEKALGGRLRAPASGEGQKKSSPPPTQAERLLPSSSPKSAIALPFLSSPGSKAIKPASQRRRLCLLTPAGFLPPTPASQIDCLIARFLGRRSNTARDVPAAGDPHLPLRHHRRLLPHQRPQRRARPVRRRRRRVGIPQGTSAPAFQGWIGCENRVLDHGGHGKWAVPLAHPCCTACEIGIR